MKKDQNKTMPYSLEAEQSLLGCMLIDNEIATEILSALSSEDFYVESHRYILQAIKEVYKERKPTDLVTVSDKLEQCCRLSEIGGIVYLTDLIQTMPSSANYRYYYEIVKRDSTCRRLARSAREIEEYACGGHDEKEAIRFAEDKVFGVSSKNETSAIKPISEIVSRVLEEYQKRAEDKSAIRGVMTGINRLDRLTNGLQKTNLIVLAARPGVGKTSLAMNIVEHAALNGKVCAVFSLEMSDEELTKRLISSVAEVSHSKADSGELGVDEWRRMIIAAERIDNCKIEIVDSSLVTPAEIFSKCRRIKAEHNGQLDLVMIDYIQLMHYGEKTENRVQEVSAITRELKIMAKELNVPVLALSQLKRLEKNEKPTISDLRESGAIEQDADIVMLIERPDMNATDEEIQSKNITRSTAFLNIAKNRHGGLEKIKLRFKGDITKFVNPEYDEETEARFQPPAQD